jgi:hypothetical protein
VPATSGVGSHATINSVTPKTSSSVGMGAQVPGIVASVAACIVVVIQGWTALSLAYLWAFGPSDLAQAFPEDGLDGSGRGPAALLADATVAAGWVSHARWRRSLVLRVRLVNRPVARPRRGRALAPAYSRVAPAEPAP